MTKENECEDFDLFNRIAETQARPMGTILTRDEVKNEIWIILLTVKDTYDDTKGNKENYYRNCVRRRLINVYNEVTKRPKKPSEDAPDEDWFKYKQELQARNDLMTPREVPYEQEAAFEQDGQLPDDFPQHLIPYVEILKEGGQLSRDEINELRSVVAAK